MRSVGDIDREKERGNRIEIDDEDGEKKQLGN